MTLCKCGCGKETNKYSVKSIAKNKSKGEYADYVVGHNLRCLTKEQKEKNRQNKIKVRIPKDFLIKKYLEEGLTFKQIGDLLGVSWGAVQRNMKDYGLKWRQRSDYEQYNKGKTFEQVFGEEKAKKLKKIIKKNRAKQIITEEHKKNIGNGLKKAYKEGSRKIIKGKNHPYYGKMGKDAIGFGHRHTEEAKRKIGISSSIRIKERWDNNEDFREMMTKLSIKRRPFMKFPKKDTTIEVKIQEFLKELGVEFFTHHYIGNIKNSYRCDIFIPSLQLICEVDGDFWHSNPKFYSEDKLNQRQKEQRLRDSTRNSELKEAGYQVMRLWECDIRAMNLETFKNRLSEFDTQDEIRTGVGA